MIRNAILKSIEGVPSVHAGVVVSRSELAVVRIIQRVCGAVSLIGTLRGF